MKKTFIALVVLGALIPSIIHAAPPITKPSAAETERASGKVSSLTNQLIFPQNAAAPGGSGGNGNQAAQALGSAAQERAQAMQTLAQAHPAAFLANIIPKNIRATLAPGVQAHVEQLTTLSGTMEVLHVDDLEKKEHSRFLYTLRSGGNSYDVYFAQTPPAMGSGATAQITGYLLGNTFVASGGSGDTYVATPVVNDAIGPQRTLVILVTPPYAHPPLTRDQVSTAVFKGHFNNFYKEQSEQKISFYGDVTDWITVPNVRCTVPYIDAPEVRSYLLSKGYNLSHYARIMFVGNAMGGGCAYVGKINVSFNGAMYRLSLGWTGLAGYDSDYRGMSYFDFVLAHEMGHELGVMHSNSWTCTGPSLDKNCYHSEYGNSFDVMGSGYFSKHFNAFYKDYLGWLPAASKKRVTTTSSHALAPLEASMGVRTLIVSNPSITSVNPLTPPMYIEFRQPLGYDRFLETIYQGLHINQVIQPAFAGFPFPRLLNANYATNSMGSPILQVGSTFSWPSRGVAVNFLKSGAGWDGKAVAGLSVHVTPLKCERGNLTFVDDYSSLVTAPGGYGGLQFRMTNNDSLACAPLSLTVSASVGNPPWYLSVYPDTPIRLSSGEEQFASLTFFVPTNASVGQIPLRVTVTDSSTGRSFVFERMVTIKEPVILGKIAPESGPVGTQVVLTGSGFSQQPFVNTVYFNAFISNQSYTAEIPATTGQSTTLAFNVPARVQSNNEKGAGGTDTSVPTPPGTYYVYVRNSDQTFSYPLAFEVTAAPLAANSKLQVASAVEGLIQALKAFYKIK